MKLGIAILRGFLLWQAMEIKQDGYGLRLFTADGQQMIHHVGNIG